MKTERRRADAPKKRHTHHHIKAFWETHQTLMKYRDHLPDAMAGPPPSGGVSPFGGAQADYKAPVELKSCLSEFHHKPFDVVLIKEA